MTERWRPGQQAIAEDIGLHRRDVRKALTILRDAKLIDYSGTRGRATIYRLQPHNWERR